MPSGPSQSQTRPSMERSLPNSALMHFGTCGLSHASERVMKSNQQLLGARSVGCEMDVVLELFLSDVE
ncbi:hypothetical protein DdX_17749 [Ditylenchus destructor]|uniref:Uncharacterized protein n=1 Tax=Ditylenchus destructor TaxID=166010 RepID=A0AAD4MNJ6_9BILA|nr:hypothetical protein DdX_17749 [Ditylenchus destructor]